MESAPGKRRWLYPGYSSPLGRKAIRFLLQGILLFLLLTAVAYAASLLVVRGKESAAADAWGSIEGPERELSARFAPLLKNQAASEYEAVVAPIGLQVFHSGAPGALFEWSPWDEILNDLHQYLERELEEASAFCAPPPSDLERHLAPLLPALVQARELWLGPAPPQWETRPGLGAKSPSPHYLALQLFGEWLLADALEAASKGELLAAERDCEAAWALVRALQARPEVRAQATAMALASELSGTLRKLGAADERWTERLQVAPFLVALEGAVALEGRGYLESCRAIANQPFRGRGARREKWLWKLFGRLWVRYSLAYTSERLAESLQRRRAHGLCGDFPKYEEPKNSYGWMAGGKNGAPQHRQEWVRLLRLRQNMEFTRAVLGAMRVHRENGGRWPAAMPPSLLATECPATALAYHLLESGGGLLEGSGYIAYPLVPGTIDLPLRFEASP